jgi:hypothetical protein
MSKVWRILMGYTTNFDGTFSLDKPLAPEHAAYLRRFSETRRMKRDPDVASAMPDPERIAAGLPIGDKGCFFTGGTGLYGQNDDPSVLEHNCPPDSQPGLWCQWVPTESGDGIQWDQCEKFYEYIEWLQYIITNFLDPWGYRLSGSVSWTGEESTDLGCIEVEANRVTVKRGRVVY